MTKQAIFLAWLKQQGFRFAMVPTPERMLKSPDSLTRDQRAWLTAHISDPETTDDPAPQWIGQKAQSGES